MSRRGESIYKRKDGRWEARYIHHYENGVAKYRYLYAHSYAEVKAKRLEELTQPELVRASNVKSIARFKELSMMWLADVKPTVKESTYTRYYRIVDHYILPTWADMQIVLIDSMVIKSFAMNLLSAGGVNQQPLSAKTVSDILCVLKCIFKFGKANGYPCDDLEQVKLPSASTKSRSIITDKSREQIEQTILIIERFFPEGFVILTSSILFTSII